MTPKDLGSGMVGLAVAWIALAIGPMAIGRQGPAMPKKAAAAKGVPRKDAVKKEAARDPIAADSITLKDGKTLLGQVYDPSPRGTLVVIVRRAWAEANLPEWAERWKKGEGEAAGNADVQRHDRLVEWKRDRLATPGAADPISAWLDRELARPIGEAEPSALMVARLGRSDVKAVQRRGMSAARALRLGWQLGFKDVEAMPLEELKDAISGRGITVAGETPISLDALLPRGPEPDDQWRARRAATEVLHDEGLRFVRYGNTVLAEPGLRPDPDPAAATTLITDTLKDFLGGTTGDPLQGKLRDVAARGRVGAMVTKLDMSPDMETVTVESSLWVRGANGTWTRAVTRSGTLRTGDVAPGAVDAVADDPQVKAAFGLIDSVGLFQVTDEMKRKSLTVGATTKKALGLARSALSTDLSSLALPLDDPGKGPKEKP